MSSQSLLLVLLYYARDDYYKMWPTFRLQSRCGVDQQLQHTPARNAGCDLFTIYCGESQSSRDARPVRYAANASNEPQQHKWSTMYCRTTQVVKLLPWRAWAWRRQPGVRPSLTVTLHTVEPSPRLEERGGSRQLCACAPSETGPVR